MTVSTLDKQTITDEIIEEVERINLFWNNVLKIFHRKCNKMNIKRDAKRE